LNGIQHDELLSLVASAERSSEHPLGKAVVNAAQKSNLITSVPESFEAIPGHGIKAVVQGQEIVIGIRMLKAKAISVPESTQDQITLLETEGNTVLPVAIDNEVAGLMVISDSVRPESNAAIANLKKLGIQETLLISGDNQAAARSVGKMLGVDQVFANTLPEQKLALIDKFQQKGLKVAYVGDGVNDAPALAKADVGIAMGTIGTNVAMETADIVLLTDKIKQIPFLVHLSRTGLGVIRNNVIFSMMMNILSVVLSVAGVIGPVLGAIMHELSALPVVANSARLINRKSNL
jgi:Cd2+/Zn2+-exporting ATPase